MADIPIIFTTQKERFPKKQRVVWVKQSTLDSMREKLKMRQANDKRRTV